MEIATREPEPGTAGIGREPEPGAARVGREPEPGAARIGREPEPGTARVWPGTELNAHHAGPSTAPDADAHHAAPGAGPGRISLRQPLVRALAVRLALAKGEAVADDVLVRDLWGDAELARPSARLRVLASRLRGALGEESAALARTAAGFRLDAVADDLAEVTNRVAELETARRAGRWAEVHAAADAALNCWRGDPLQDLPDLPFVVAEQQRLESLCVELRLDWVESGLELGTGGIDDELERLIGKYPLHERLVRLAATAAVRAGDLQGALSRLDALRERLADELGIDPSPETAGLEHQLRNGGALAPARNPSTSASTPPPHQLPPTISLPQAHKAFVGRDREYAELLAQIAAPEAFGGHPLTSSGPQPSEGGQRPSGSDRTGVPNNESRPSDRTGVPNNGSRSSDRTGVLSDGLRHSHQAEVHHVDRERIGIVGDSADNGSSGLGRDQAGSSTDKVRAGDTAPYAKVVTLTGGPGVGKTRLAREVAWREGARGRRIGWVDLGPLGPSDSLVAVLAATLGVDGSSEDPLARCAEELTGGLLVLDNAEHLVDNTAALVEGLLKFGAGTSVIVTSQRLLRIPAEEERRLRPLAAAAAAELFCARSAAEPGPEVDAICAAVDRLPLAIELAAGLTRTLSVTQLAERIDNRLRLLVRGPRDAGIRHTSLRAALDWSHELLETPERVALRRLSVFAGGFTAEAAQAVIADPPTSTDNPTGPRTSTDDPTGPRTDPATAAMPSTPTDSATPTTAGDREVGPTRSPSSTPLADSAGADTSATVTAGTPTSGAAVPGSASSRSANLDTSANPTVPRESADAAPAPGTPLPDPTGAPVTDPPTDAGLVTADANAREVLPAEEVGAVLAELVERCVLTVESSAEGVRFRLLETVRDYALERLREAGEEELLRGRHVEWYGCFVRRYEGMGARNNTGVGAEEANLLAAIDWCLGEGAQAEKVSALVAPLWWYWPGRGLMVEASEWLERSLAVLPPDSDEYAAGLSTVASLTRNRGLITEARTIGERSLAAFRALGDEEKVTIGLMSLTRTCLAQGDMVATLAHAEEVEQRCRADDRVTRRARASALNYMGLAHRNLRHPAEATELFEAARDRWQEIEDFGGVAIAMENLAIVARQTGQHELAHRWAVESLRRARESAFSMGICGALESIACLAVAEGRAEEGLQLLAATEQHRTKLGLPVQVPDELADVAQARTTAYEALGSTADKIIESAQDLPLEELADRYLD
ncbi:BTAD domain-containing putative transcriptional regulator [Kribbella sp. CA-253562]|uniref:AfsR/SARP family transcriptional regulator n=1 Tax=Kribbella sp. CA-253562 TaxID=3239942 RepID=UPI003D8C8B81